MEYKELEQLILFVARSLVGINFTQLTKAEKNIVTKMGKLGILTLVLDQDYQHIVALPQNK